MIMFKLVVALFLHTIASTDAGAQPFSECDLRCRSAMQDILGQMDSIVKAKVYELNGWVKSRKFIFKLFDVYTDYKTATDRCNELGGRLASEILRHSETVRFMIAENYVAQGRPWVGYDDIATEGRWMWADGGVTDPQTTGWRANEPNSYQGANEDCAHLDGNTDYKVLMNDRPCRDKQTYICEINIDDL